MRDLNANGRADSGEPEVSGTEIVTLDPGQAGEFVIVGSVPAAAGGQAARVRITATSATQSSLSASNTDTIQAAMGVITAISKSVSPSRAEQGKPLDYTLSVVSTGGMAPAAIAAAVDGRADRLVLVRDTIPANTRFVSFLESPSNALRLYHTAGSPQDTYTTNAPQELSAVDAIAIGLSDWGAPNRALQLPCRTMVNANATGEIVNVARLRYADSLQGGAVVSSEAVSNATRVPMPAQAPTVTFFTDDTYSDPAILTQANQPLRIQVSSAACNQDSSQIERIQVTLTSRDTGDTLSFEAFETGPNTGIFRPRANPRAALKYFQPRRQHHPDHRARCSDSFLFFLRRPARECDDLRGSVWRGLRLAHE